MNLSDMIVVLTQTADVEEPGVFPFPLGMHLAFVIIGTLFFLYRFSREKLPYQMILAIAIPVSLILQLSENRTLFYAVGAAELVLLLAALITSFIFKKKPEPEAEKAEDNAEPAKEEKPEAAPAENNTAEQANEDDQE